MFVESMAAALCQVPQATSGVKPLSALHPLQGRCSWGSVPLAFLESRLPSCNKRFIINDQACPVPPPWRALPVWGGKEPDTFLLAGLLSKAADAEQVTAQSCRPDAWRADSLYVEGKWGTVPDWPRFYCVPQTSPGYWCE